MRDAMDEIYLNDNEDSGLLSRRRLLAAGLGAAAATMTGLPALAAPQVVPLPGGQQYGSGTIIISLRQRRLLLTSGDGRAIAYPVAVGMSGKAWAGWARVDGKHVNPAWMPPAVVRAAVRGLPSLIPGGAPNNPMGPRALTLDRHEIAIHGTTRSMRRSIGSAASFGCIRMYNEDILDLFDRVSVGTPVLAV